MTDTTPVEADWLRPEEEDNDLRRYAATIRARGWLIVLAVVLATVAAAAYVVHATPVYEAQSDLLVTPLAASATLPSVPGLIPQSSDPTRDSQTAANIVESITVASGVKASLHLPGSPASILAQVSVAPVSDSDIIAITARSGTATGAAALANAFARTVIAQRTTRFRTAIAQQIAGLKAQVNAGSSATSVALQQQLAALRTLQAGPLPDMSMSALAVPPSGRTSPRAILSIAAGIIVGFVIGVLGVLGLEAFDTTLRREDQLRRLFRLPVLARVPRVGRPGRLARHRDHQTPRTPETLPVVVAEAFRTLRAMTLVSHSPGARPPRSVLVTSASPNEGKTTTALNLAASITASGASVIFIEGDLRRPSVGAALGVLSRYDLTDVLTGEAELSEALVSSKSFPNVSFLLAQDFRSGSSVSGDVLFLPTVPQLLAEAEQMADFVVVDSPPLLAVIDALGVARQVDCVLLVAKLGRTQLGRLAALGSMLAEAHIVPVGIALIGAELPGPRDAYVYQYANATSAVSSVRDERAREVVSSRAESISPRRLPLRDTASRRD